MPSASFRMRNGFVSSKTFAVADVVDEEWIVRSARGVWFGS